jgi:hypothetical protein
MRIATEDEPEDYGSVSEKDEAAAKMARKGAAVQAADMTPERAAEIARVLALVEAAVPAPARRRTYKKRKAA